MSMFTLMLANAQTTYVNFIPQVFSGITLTKFGGIIVLAFSSSQIFEVTSEQSSLNIMRSTVGGVGCAGVGKTRAGLVLGKHLTCFLSFWIFLCTCP